mmetsp:Transcript_103307/g.183011  ORF Transcript_103307/g.183011 Transcript_103307/m.183011 type:complete len:84 (+) Transcript_103307:128-379(+)
MVKARELMIGQSSLPMCCVMIESHAHLLQVILHLDSGTTAPCTTFAELPRRRQLKFPQLRQVAFHRVRLQPANTIDLSATNKH